ncbi:hypothetical protein DAEQUDRAFT_721733 [Daedalea quercina L-15889]|uniref:Aminoglycoside phosphotransferase domain-containing protein n=1 Tax=Daedalea quercina L-15889 TaxID=1314783 RepID=A0A165TMD4_9APHY|nr:hypothetical protein DAEQUDRAFT_721733 [Daedalea quercina L-15889]
MCDELSSWFDDAQHVVIRNPKKPVRLKSQSSFLRSVTLQAIMGTSPLVPCHQDLNMRNIIVGDDGRLWLVGWAWSRFYPPWFEYLAMKEQAENEERVMGR